MKKYHYLFCIAVLALVQGCDVFSGSEQASKAAFSQQEIQSGGATTVYKTDGQSFAQPAPNLSQKELQKHLIGDKNFEDSFVTAPSALNEGLGPLYNNKACISCHVNDGRGKPFLSNGKISSVLVRLSMNGDTPGSPRPVPGFGLQLQNKSIYSKEYEADVKVVYDYITQTIGDGTGVELRKPNYQVRNPYKPLSADVSLSVRTAPPVFGMGLLEAIPKQQILAHADTDDKDGDGISGKPNYVRNDVTGKMQLGRFGWKANQPTIKQQVAAAYNQDMGVTSPYYSHDNPYQNPDAEDSLSDDPEISQETLDETILYVATLGIPAKRVTNESILKHGEKLFARAGCQSCHLAHFKTTGDAEIPALANQHIYPYTDLLLHDMGEGLADHRSDFDASGREWRTPPLWGIGLVEKVNGHQSFLHDGRARSLLEAILWHGGEAKNSRKFVKQLSESDRNALVAFVKAI